MTNPASFWDMPEPDVKRGSGGSPMLVPEAFEDHEDPMRVEYTRASYMADFIESKTHIHKWEMRYLARGLGQNEDLAALAATETYSTGLETEFFDPNQTRAKTASGRRLDSIIERTFDRVKLHEKADRGTAVHGFTEPGAPSGSEIPARLALPVEAFWEKNRRECIETLGTELFTANDITMSAGTFDHSVRVYGHPDLTGIVIGDKKGLPLDTPLPTPAGWTTMGEVQEGDVLLGSNGRPAEVLSKSEIHHKPCVRVNFDDGTSMVCDVEHRWPVYITRLGVKSTRVMTAGELAERLHGKPAHWHYAVATPDSLDLPAVDLPVAPYVLGVWLGDGKHTTGEVTFGDEWTESEVERSGYELGLPQQGEGCRSRTILGLSKGLRSLGVLGEKRIPAAYLRGAHVDRLALMQGLLDSDGCWNKTRKHVIITLTDEQLARDVHELALTLGQRARIWPVSYAGFGVTGTAWTVTFTPRRGVSPFRLPRKADLVQSVKGTAKSHRRVITSIEPVEQVPTQCIEVASPDHTYLCGRDMLVTHNTGRFDPLSWAIQMSTYAYGKVYNTSTDRRLQWPDQVNLKHALVWQIDCQDYAKANRPEPRDRVKLWVVDIELGWKLAQLAATVRDETRDHNAIAGAYRAPSFQQRLNLCNTREALAALWHSLEADDPRRATVEEKGRSL